MSTIYHVTTKITATAIGTKTINGDENVGFADLVILARNYGQKSGVTAASGDLNGDGSVGFDDLVILARRYGHKLGPGTPT